MSISASGTCTQSRTWVFRAIGVTMFEKSDLAVSFTASGQDCVVSVRTSSLAAFNEGDTVSVTISTTDPGSGTIHASGRVCATSGLLDGSVLGYTLDEKSGVDDWSFRAPSSAFSLSDTVYLRLT